MAKRNLIKDVLLGVAIGDALGVPVEYASRSKLKQDPVAGMRSYGMYQQPAGTWSDDSSLTFCLAEMLCAGYDLQNLANRFVNWKNHGYWTAHGSVFDIGISIHQAIDLLEMGIEPTLAGGYQEYDNGNGSLMRILPLLFFIQHMDIHDRFCYVKDISSLTHRHIRSILCCFIYLEFALCVIKGSSKLNAYVETCDHINRFIKESSICSETELKSFAKVLSAHVYEIPEDNIQSSGYVLHTLEAAFWCILNTSNFNDAVLKSVNLGSDTDTTGAVTGGLAGLIYGSETIFQKWLSQLVRRDDIENLSDRLNTKIYGS